MFYETKAMKNKDLYIKKTTQADKSFKEKDKNKK